MLGFAGLVCRLQPHPITAYHSRKGQLRRRIRAMSTVDREALNGLTEDVEDVPGVAMQAGAVGLGEVSTIGARNAGCMSPFRRLPAVLTT